MFDEATQSSINLKYSPEYKLNDNKNLQGNRLEDNVTLLVLRDLLRLGWSANYSENIINLTPPENYSKLEVRDCMAIKRQEIIDENIKWIGKHKELARKYIANGYDVLKSKIDPVIEICNTKEQHNLFRLLRYYWSSPYSEYVGRRIKIIIRDAALPNNPVIGIAALGSPIIHIPERDEWIGWDIETRTKNINYTMDAYIIGALPPYNYLLGGKLISYILASKEVRDIIREKYSCTKYNQIAGFFTTGLYGKSAQYNRVKYRGRLLYNPIGKTKGYGTHHLTKETFNAMNDYLKNNEIIVSNEFGAGPSWSMRVIRNAGRLLGFDADLLLKHSFKRQVYFVPFAKNSVSFLNGRSKSLRYYQSSISALTSHWKRRWLNGRKNNNDVIEEIKWFNRTHFDI